MKKKLLITGGSGFIGSHLVTMGLKNNFKVLNLDKLTYSGNKNKIKHKDYSFSKVDITNEKKVFKALKDFKPNFIINCAAESHVDNSILEPRIFFKSNVIGTLNLLIQMLKLELKCRFLQISTDEVFGSLRIGEKKFNEKSNYFPKSPYSASKASSDHIVRSFGNTYGIDYIITNCSNNYGPMQHKEKLIPKVIDCCVKRKKIPVYGKGNQIRDWIYVEDHCEAVLKSLIYGKTGNTYLIGANQEMRNIHLVKEICKQFDIISGEKNSINLIEFVKDRPGHDYRYAINSIKIKRELNWKPKFKFKDSLRKTIIYYLKN